MLVKTRIILQNVIFFMTNFYICTNNDFNLPENLKGNYKIITDGTELQNTYPYPIIKADNELEPLKHAYSEGYMIYDIWKKDTESDFIGINHYRRYLQGQIIEDLQENILPIPMAFNMLAQYQSCHHINDLIECINIIHRHWPDYNTDIPFGFYPCNIALLERSIFDEWCDFVFGVLEIFNERMKFTTDEDVKKYVSQFFPSDKVDYQSRLHAFLLERLSTIYFTNKFKNKPLRLSQIMIVK